MKVSAPTAEGMQTRNMLTEEGIFHMNIVSVMPSLKANGEPGPCDTIECDVLGGQLKSGKPIDSVVGQKIKLTFWEADPTKPQDDQDRTNQQNTALLLATNLIGPQQLGQEFEANIADINGQQFIVELERKLKKNNAGELVADGTYLRVRFSNIWHINDPDVAHVAKNAGAIKYVEPRFIKPPEYFSWKKKHDSHTASSATKSAGTNQAAAGAGIGSSW